MRVYLDICCLHRPFDDQTLERIRRESASVQEALNRIRSGEWQWVGSEILSYEVEVLPPGEAGSAIQTWVRLCSSEVRLDEVIIGRAEEFHLHGLRNINALHLACAEAGEVDCFLSTDEHLVATARSLRPRVRVANPLEVAGNARASLAPSAAGAGDFTTVRRTTLLDGNVREMAARITAERQTAAAQ